MTDDRSNPYQSGNRPPESLRSGAPALGSTHDCNQPDDKSRREAFATVMRAALGSLLLRGGADEAMGKDEENRQR